MPVRVNTKFVFILIAILAAITVAIGASWFIVNRNDTAENITRGRQYMKDGNYDDALIQFGRALRNDKTNPAILLMYTQAKQAVPVKSVYELAEADDQIIGSWRKIVAVSPQSPQATEARHNLLSYYYEGATKSAVYNAWQSLYDTAQEILSAAVSEDQAVARQYRAMAQVQKLRGSTAEEAERIAACKEMQAVVDVSPPSARLTYQLAQWNLIESDFQAKAGHPERIAQLQADAIAIMQRFLDAHPDDPDALLQAARLQMVAGHRDKALEQLTLLESKVKPEDRDNLMELASLLERIDLVPADPAKPKVRRGQLRAEKLYVAQLARDKDDERAQLYLGRNLLAQGRIAEAQPLLEQAAADRSRRVSIEGLRGAANQQYAIISLSELHLTQLESATDDASRTAILAKMKQCLGELRERSREDSGMPDMLEGKIALVEGRYTIAERMFDSANTKYGGAYVDALVLQARALRMLNQPGEAARKLKAAIAAPEGRNQWVAYRELAVINLKLNEPQQSLDLLKAILLNTPDDMVCQQLRIRATAALSRKQAQAGLPEAPETMKQAIKLGESLKGTGDKQILLLLASLYYADNQREAAHAILEPMLAKAPADDEVLRAVLRMDVAEKQNDRAIARVNTAIKADPSQQKSLELLRAQLSKEGATIDQYLAEREDPLDRALLLTVYHQQKGNKAEADKALSEAEKSNPDDPRVIALQFEKAIEKSDWPAAQALADRAAKLNLDDAQGMFWLGRLEMAHGKLTSALTALNRGVTLRPRYAEGWVLLGEARRQNNDLTGADAAYSTALELQPNNIRALQSQFVIQDARGQYAGALKAIQKAVEFAPENRALTSTLINYMARHGDAARALKMRQQWAQQEPNDTANRRLLASLYISQNQPQAAREVLEQLLKDEPANIDNIVAMAQFHRLSGQAAQGQAMLTKYVTDRGDKASASDWMSVARFLVDADQTPLAEAAFRKAIDLEDKKAMPATREMADWYFSRGDATKSLPFYESLSKNDAEDPRIARRIVEVLVRMGRFEQAQQNLDAFVAKHGPDVQTALLDGMIAENLGAPNAERAQRSFDRAVQLSPGNAQAYYYRARFNFNRTAAEVQARVRGDLEHALDLDPNMTIASEMLVAWYLDPRRADESSAITELRRAISKRPDYRSARIQLSQLYLRQRRYGELDQLLTDSQQQSPDPAIWHQTRAQAYIAQGQSAKAMTELEQAYNGLKAPETLTGYVVMLLEASQAPKADQLLTDNAAWVEKSAVLAALRGRSRAAMGKTDEATASFAQAFSLAAANGTDMQTVLAHSRRVLNDQQIVDMLQKRAAGDASGLTDLVLAQLMIEKGQASEAAAELKTLITRLKPGTGLSDAAQRLLASALDKSGQYEDSLTAYNELLKVHPDDVTLLNNAAYILAENLKRPADAMPLARKAADRVPPIPLAQASVLDTLGWVQFRVGNVDEAEITLRRSIQISPIPAVHLHLAEVLQAKNQIEPAREQVNAARRLAEEKKDKDTLDKAQKLLQALSTGQKDAK